MHPSFLTLFVLLIFSTSAISENESSATGESIFGESRSFTGPGAIGYGNSPDNSTESSNSSASLHSILTSLPVTSGSISSNRSIKILSQDNFTDSMNNFHVRGEIENLVPTSIKYVRVTGTFYDSSGQILGSFLSLTYPSDIDAGGKAQFELLALSGSISVDKIDRYALQFDFG